MTAPDAGREPSDELPAETLTSATDDTNDTAQVNREWEYAAIRSIDHNRRAYYEGRSEAFWLSEYRRAGCA